MPKIYGQKKALSEDDRLTLVKILAKAGYVVSTRSCPARQHHVMSLSTTQEKEIQNENTQI